MSKEISRVELETVLHEVEACVNSRPLTFVGDAVDAREPLTPAHLLLGHGGGFYGAAAETKLDPTVSPQSSAEDLVLQHERRRALVDEFFSIWSSEYIRNLPAGRGGRSHGTLKVGSMVLLQDEKVPRLSWPTAVVTKVLDSSDGLIRTVEVTTGKGNYVRSLQRLHQLEGDVDPDVDFPQAQPAGGVPDVDFSQAEPAEGAMEQDFAQAEPAGDPLVPNFDHPNHVQEPAVHVPQAPRVSSRGRQIKDRVPFDL